MSERDDAPALWRGLDLGALRRKLAQRPRRSVRLEGYRESAVLVPLLVPADEGEAARTAELLYTVRQPTLPTHAGQIAFPGGKRDPEDTSAHDTALREASEEVGIPGDAVSVLGLLDDIATPLGFVITPVVGAVRWPLELLPSQAEVAEVFTVPLPSLPTVYRNGGEAVWRGYHYTMHEFHVETRRIWGATAAITMQLLDLLDLVHLPPRDPDALR
ncbi:MAG: CoA pyrophosphatase [Polyangia bacterium]